MGFLICEGHIGMCDFESLEKTIGYCFADKDKLTIALTHSSYANERHINKYECNERYEFLGDAVLELSVSDFLFRNYKNYPEGKLTKTRASIVCEPTLFLCAEKINLGVYLLLGKGEDQTGGRQRPSVVSDAMEALIGAIYLDGGIEPAFKFIQKFILDNIDEIELFHDCKTTLQELIQGKYNEQLKYVLIKEDGPDHNKIFVTRAVLGNRVLSEGVGHTKKSSEQDAAFKALKKLKSV